MVMWRRCDLRWSVIPSDWIPDEITATEHPRTMENAEVVGMGVKGEVLYYGGFFSGGLCGS